MGNEAKLYTDLLIMLSLINDICCKLRDVNLWNLLPCITKYLEASIGIDPIDAKGKNHKYFKTIQKDLFSNGSLIITKYIYIIIFVLILVTSFSCCGSLRNSFGGDFCENNLHSTSQNQSTVSKSKLSPKGDTHNEKCHILSST